MTEEAVVFGESASLVGVITERRSKQRRHAKTAVILLNPGIVHRVGAGRIYVKVARALASIGFISLRFDFSGIGDSPVRHDNLQFDKSAVAEARNAMDFLAETNGIEHFILLGGCSGAKVAFDVACSDARVIGALLINFPSVEDEDEVGSTHRGAFAYYRRYAIVDLRSWWRLVSGKARYGQLLSALWHETKMRISPKESVSQEAIEFRSHLSALVDRNTSLNFICSDGDHRLGDLKKAAGQTLRQLCAEGKIKLDIIKRSDHTFSSLSDQNQLIQVLLKRADEMTENRNQVAKASTLAAALRVLPELQS